MLATCSERSITLALLLACCCLAGCGGSRKGQLPTAQVTGQVTRRGTPLARGQIKFIPMESSGQGARVAYGTLDEQGRYRLSTYSDGDGAILGDYRVAVESRDELPDDVVKQMIERGERPPRPKSLIPERYADPVHSGLTAHVGPGSNTLNLDLKE
jgi:hypothetical protein